MPEPTKQAKALELMCQGKTDAEIAATISVHPATVWKWRHRPKFAARLVAARKRGIEHAIEALDMLAADAIATLAEIMRNKKASDKVRVAASAQILDRVGVSASEGVRRQMKTMTREAVALVLEKARQHLPPEMFPVLYASIYNTPTEFAEKVTDSAVDDARIQQLAATPTDLSPEELDAVGRHFADEARKAREALASQNADAKP